MWKPPLLPLLRAHWRGCSDTPDESAMRPVGRPNDALSSLIYASCLIHPASKDIWRGIFMRGAINWLELSAHSTSNCDRLRLSQDKISLPLPRTTFHDPRVSERLLRVELQRKLPTAILFENVKWLCDHLRLATQIAATRFSTFSQISGLSNKSECLLNGSL